MGSPQFTQDDKIVFFKWVFGWYDPSLFDLMRDKYTDAQKTLPEPKEPKTYNLDEPIVQEFLHKHIKRLIQELIGTPQGTTTSTTLSTDTGTDSAMDKGEEIKQKIANKQAAVKAKDQAVKEKDQNAMTAKAYQKKYKNWTQFEKKNDEEKVKSATQAISTGEPLDSSPINEALEDELVVVPGDKDEAKQFVKMHYLGNFPPDSRFVYIVKKKMTDEPVGTVIYGTPMFAARNFLKGVVDPREILELKRLFLLGEVPKNAESFVIAKANKMIKQDSPTTKVILTFADERQGHKGSIYQATNAIYLGLGKSGLHKYAYILRGDLNQIRAGLQPYVQPYPE
jgi:hypothetical protein